MEAILGVRLDIRHISNIPEMLLYMKSGEWIFLRELQCSAGSCPLYFKLGLFLASTKSSVSCHDRHTWPLWQVYRWWKYILHLRPVNRLPWLRNSVAIIDSSGVLILHKWNPTSGSSDFPQVFTCRARYRNAGWSRNPIFQSKFCPNQISQPNFCQNLSPIAFFVHTFLGLNSNLFSLKKRSKSSVVIYYFRPLCTWAWTKEAISQPHHNLCAS